VICGRARVRRKPGSSAESTSASMARRGVASRRVQTKNHVRHRDSMNPRRDQTIVGVDHREGARADQLGQLADRGSVAHRRQLSAEASSLRSHSTRPARHVHCRDGRWLHHASWMYAPSEARVKLSHSRALGNRSPVGPSLDRRTRAAGRCATALDPQAGQAGRREPLHGGRRLRFVWSRAESSSRVPDVGFSFAHGGWRLPSWPSRRSSTRRTTQVPTHSRSPAYHCPTPPTSSPQAQDFFRELADGSGADSGDQPAVARAVGRRLGCNARPRDCSSCGSRSRHVLCNTV